MLSGAALDLSTTHFEGDVEASQFADREAESFMLALSTSTPMPARVFASGVSII